MTELTPAEQRKRRLAGQAARNRPRCAEPEHDWRAGDQFGLASGDLVTTWQCSVCLTTRLAYRDRDEPREQETRS